MAIATIFLCLKKTGAEVGNNLRSSNSVYYFEEIDIPFCSLYIVTFLVKITSHVLRYSLKHIFLKLKKKKGRIAIADDVVLAI